jgi:hypothetical protein
MNTYKHLATGETMNRTKVIQTIIHHNKKQVYLEIGVFRGSNFLKINANKKLGIDPKFRISRIKKFRYFLKNFSNLFNQYYAMTSDEFFAHASAFLKKDGIDIAFIDGLHTYQQSLTDVQNCLQYLNQAGIIVMHDCNPQSESDARLFSSIADAATLNTSGKEKEWCGDVWKTIVNLRSIRNDLQVFVLNCDRGLGIITRGTPENTLNYSLAALEQLTYQDLAKDRTKLLNLKGVEYFPKFLESAGNDGSKTNAI